MNAFQPGDYQRFVFAGHDWLADTATLRLHYRLEPGIKFTETVVFPKPVSVSRERQPALTAAIQLLHWAAGVSYWKAACPAQWIFESTTPDTAQLQFLLELYTQGLGEFAYVNELDIKSRLQQISQKIETESLNARPAAALNFQARCLVPIGGGKDSLVAAEMLKSLDTPATATAVRPAALIGQVARQTGLPWLPVQRHIAPELLALNQQGAWNGHVPITAINACILLVAAILYDYRWIVFANEASADEPTLAADGGLQINHQYSKSSRFERALQDYIEHYIAPDLQCFSILRPLSELAVCQRFAALENYHSAFSSCNRQFHLDGARTQNRWCGQCPKCQFVFLALAPFMDSLHLTSIFGGNLLDNAAHTGAFAGLCGLGDKPFECVGTVAESRAALMHLAGQPEWRDVAVLQALQADLAGAETVPLPALLKPDAAAVAQLPQVFRSIYGISACA